MIALAVGDKPIPAHLSALPFKEIHPPGARPQAARLVPGVHSSLTDCQVALTPTNGCGGKSG